MSHQAFNNFPFTIHSFHDSFFFFVQSISALGRASEPEKNHLSKSTIVFNTKRNAEVGPRNVTSATQLLSSGMRAMKPGKGGKDRLFCIDGTNHVGKTVGT